MRFEFKNQFLIFIAFFILSFVGFGQDSLKTINFSDRDSFQIGNENIDSLLKNTSQDSLIYFVVLQKEFRMVDPKELHKYLSYKDFKTVSYKNAVFYVIDSLENIEPKIGCHPRHDD